MVDFPKSLWQDPNDLTLVEQMTEFLADVPMILTDRLANSVFFNPAAERLFDQDGEAIVNRAAFSLLGFGTTGKTPPGLTEALLGKKAPWRGAVQIESTDKQPPVFCEASAIMRDNCFICGVLRFTSQP